MDLTGRFPERYNRVKSRWERFLADMMTVLLHATIKTVEIEYHRVEPQDVWDAFVGKWKIHEGLDLESLERRTR